MAKKALPARAPHLKVFRTRIGFHEVAVAAASQKAALAALGVHADLFRQGAAGVTQDVELVRRALEQPGVPVRREIDMRAALTAPPAKKAAKKAEPAKPAGPDPAAVRAAKTAVEAARAALKSFEREAKAELALLEDERRDVALREARAKTGHAARRKRLTAALETAMRAAREIGG